MSSSGHGLARSVLLALVSATSIASAAEVTAPQMIDAFEGTFGAHAGQRRNHIKGTCAAGEFVGTTEAAALSRSVLFSGKPIPVVARFSLGGGNPEVPDAAPAPRGMALEFRLPGGALHHITMINAPIFAARTPASFRDALIAARPDPKTGQPDPEKLKAYLATHPDAMALRELSSGHNPTANYYQTPYFGIHTFKFIDSKNAEHLVKWRFVPRDGVKELTAEEMKAAPHDFLEKNLIERTGKAPAVWDMIVYVGEPGDPQDDPTLAWPETRKHFKAGTLTITQATPQQKGKACEPINFDPLVMTDGVAPTNDPVLLFRSPAYAVSFGKRLSGQ
ncbi:catalase family peroxidase [Peristeroidobacter soli]|uniref:catalase family peroxidase n=1 Tax=Peristeroidobacter soli TaxID=2497877 RepID=UPI00101D7028|nr:catalase family peroxidase [Peristeroidobacter soli]